MSEKAPEWFDKKPWDREELEYGTFFPDIPLISEKDKAGISVRPNRLKPKPFPHLLKKMRLAYEEIISAFNSQLNLLCTIGIRSLFEEISDDKKLVTANKNLQMKIANLANLGVPVPVTENLVLLGDFQKAINDGLRFE